MRCTSQLGANATSATGEQPRGGCGRRASSEPSLPNPSLAFVLHLRPSGVFVFSSSSSCLLLLLEGVAIRNSGPRGCGYKQRRPSNRGCTCVCCPYMSSFRRRCAFARAAAAPPSELICSLAFAAKKPEPAITCLGTLGALAFCFLIDAAPPSLPALRHCSAVHLLHYCLFCSIPAGSPTNRGAGLLRSSRLLRPRIGVEPAAGSPKYASKPASPFFAILSLETGVYSESL
jgi:hypothetical protein